MTSRSHSPTRQSCNKTVGHTDTKSVFLKVLSLAASWMISWDALDIAGSLNILFLFLLFFQGLVHRIWKFPGRGQIQSGIWTASVTYTTAHSNTGSSTHWARPGIEPASSWIRLRFLNHCATMGTPTFKNVQYSINYRKTLSNKSLKFNCPSLF